MTDKMLLPALIGALVVGVCIGAGYMILTGNEDSDDNGPGEVVTTYLVSISKDGSGSVTGAGSYLSGENVTLTATPDVGYSFAGWYEGGRVCTASSTYSFVVQSDQNLTAKFDRLSYMVHVLPSGSTAGGKVSGDGTYLYKETATLTATVNYGYRFVGWFDFMGTLVSTNTTFVTEIVGNNTIYGMFEQIYDASFDVHWSTLPSSKTLILTSKYNVEVTKHTWNVYRDGSDTGYVLSDPAASSITVPIVSEKSMEIIHIVYYKDGRSAVSEQKIIVPP